MEDEDQTKKPLLDEEEKLASPQAFADLQNDILSTILSMEFASDLGQTVKSILKKLQQFGIPFSTCSISLKQGALGAIYYSLYPLPCDWRELSSDEVREGFDRFGERITTWENHETYGVNVQTPVGVLEWNRNQIPYTEREIEVLTALANTIVLIAVRHHDLREKEKSQVAIGEVDENLLALHDASGSVFSDSQREIMENIIHLAQQTLGYDRCGIFLKDDTKGVLQGQLGINRHGEIEDISRTVYPLVLSTPQETIAVCQVARGELPFFLTPDLDGEGYQSEEGEIESNAAVAMKVGKKIIGVLCVDNYFSRQPISLSQIPSLMILANQGANALLHLASRAVQTRLTTILEGTRDFVGMADVDGRVTYINPAGREMLGIGVDEDISNTPFLDYHSKEMAQFLREEALPTAVRDGIWVGEGLFSARDGREIPTSMVVLAHKTDDGVVEYFSTISRDITQRKRAEEALHRYTERLKIRHQIDHAILTSQSIEEIARSVLPHIQQLISCRRVSFSVFDFVASQATMIAVCTDGETQLGTGRRVSLAEVQHIIEVLQQGEVYMADDLLTCSQLPPTLQFLRDEGIRSTMVIPLMTSQALVGSLNFGADTPRGFNNQHMGVGHEIANSLAVAVYSHQLLKELSDGHEQLRSLSHNLVTMQENERRHIARELHDEVGQALTQLKLTLKMTENLPVDAIEPTINEAETQVNALIGQMRDLSLSLRPSMLDDLGLLPALLWQFERYTTQTHVAVDFKHMGLEGQRFASDVETAAYRIVQEALTNVARHAHVSEVSVLCWSHENMLNIQIEDQGIGFDAEIPRGANTSAGLTMMRERAILLGGQLTLESSPETGTRVTAALPHRKKREKKVPQP